MPLPKLVKRDNERPMSPADIAAANPKSAEHVALEEKLSALRRKRGDADPGLQDRRVMASMRKREGSPTAAADLAAIDREIAVMDKEIAEVRTQWEPHREEHRRRVAEALNQVRTPLLMRILDALKVITSEVPALNDFQTELRRVGFDVETVYAESDVALEYLRAQIEAVAASEEAGFAEMDRINSHRPGLTRRG